jgi:hypothetical protein
MLTLSIVALAFAPAPAASPVALDAGFARTVACNPDPSKNRGCFREANAPATRPAVREADNRPMVHCHPDPSKNRGCLRPTHAQPGTPDDAGAALAQAD